MKRKNGFTLIELLAIIILISIIAVITVPLILNTIEDSRKKAVKDSAYGYIESVNRLFLSYSLDDPSNEILDGYYDVSNLKDMGVSISGAEPILNSWVKLSDSQVIDGCLQFGEYKVDVLLGDIVKGECDTFIPDPVSFETDSWATIKKAINEDNTDLYSVGDTKEVIIDNMSYTVRLSNKTFDGCDTEENGFSQTACGFVFEFIDVLGTNHMNSGYSNVGGWPASIIRTYLNDNDGINSKYKKLPSDLKAVIADTYTVSGHGSTVGEDNFASIDKLYLLSRKEVTGVNDTDTVGNYLDTACEYTKQLEYYKENPDASYRIKYTIDSTPVASNWWLRTAEYNSTSYFNVVAAEGFLASNPSASGEGNAPAFRIVKD